MATWGSNVKSGLWSFLKAYAPRNRRSDEEFPCSPPIAPEPCFPASKCYGADISAHSDSR